jgi:hypothetical protein
VLYSLLDEIPTAAMVGGYARAIWPGQSEDWWARMAATPSARRARENVCLGHSSQSVSITAPDLAREYRRPLKPVGPVSRDDDPLGWHEFTDFPDMSFRRVRHIDVFRDQDLVRVVSRFQDSARLPDGLRTAVHEYIVTATADADAGELVSLEADPRILPFPECPLAVKNLSRLVGCSLSSLRTTVEEILPGADGCTHLNTAVRVLADVPSLVKTLDSYSTTLRREDKA